MTVAVLGAGQLGRMLGMAGLPLGLRFVFLDPDPEAPAGQVGELIRAPFEEPAALADLAASASVATYEFENVPVAAARFLAERIPVLPPPVALEVSQDRLVEKSFFQRLGIPTPDFAPVDDRPELERAVRDIGLPGVLKTRRFGYDGKGQYMLRSLEDTARAWGALGGVPLLYETWIPFERELSIIMARSRSGQTVAYPLVENHHGGGILRLSLAPAPELAESLQSLAEDHARRVVEELGYAGVLVIEFFEQQGRLLANEMACRVHNSGHWTIEGAQTSQFENHLRAILDLPLGDPTPIGHSAMLNLIGRLPPLGPVLATSAHLHLYGKTPRPGRKLGHITLRTDREEELHRRLDELQQILSAR